MACDQLQRFIFDGTAVRGEVVQLQQTYQEVLRNQDYPEVIQQVLGRMLAACALLTATVKLDGTLSMEVRGDGPTRLLMAESNPGTHQRAQQLRGIARFDAQALAELEETRLEDLVGQGRLIITMDPRVGKRYQGIVALEEPTIAGCIETYFAQSEQLPTRLWLAADNQAAAGMLLQQLPKEAGQAIQEDDTPTDEDAWNRISHLAATLTATELTSLSTRQILHRLFHEEQLRLFDPAPVIFACTCSRERFANALHQLGAEELRSILREQGEVETQCHFCNTEYVFTAADIEALIDNPENDSPTMH